ncbi:MAG: LacI family DNA-binding transcriptional regulator [Symbiobacteriia bacterium]
MKNTIKDVARTAGVGVATVSRVINGSGYVSEDSRQRVLEAVERLHFQPSRAARSLATGRSATVALVLPDITNPFFPSIARGVEDAASAAGYTVILCNTDDDPEQEAMYLNLLRQQRVDGVVLAACAPTNREQWRQFAARIPVVLTDRRLEGAIDHSVAVNNVAGGYLAARHLIDLGHRSIGFISGPAGLSTSAERRQGFEQALHEVGALPRPEWMCTGDFRYQSGYNCAGQLQQQGVTALFAVNDMMAIGAIRAIEDAGRRVPEDVAVVGFDDILLASMTKPGLTTIGQPTYQMGVMAMDMLLERMRSDAPVGPQQLILEPSLVIRESCGGKRSGT